MRETFYILRVWTDSNIKAHGKDLELLIRHNSRWTKIISPRRILILIAPNNCSDIIVIIPIGHWKVEGRAEDVLNN